jgi:hypothetical protein
MYLYHVESDNAVETLFWQPQMLDASTGEPTRFLPLALNLFYLLFAYSATSYTEEQEAMSAALRIFHANPIVRSDPAASAPWELTLTMEHRSYDELSLLWQATTAPLRMSLVYRAAVVLIEPDEMPAAAKVASLVSAEVGTVTFPVPSGYPAVVTTFRSGSYVGPTGVAAGQSVWLTGSDLGVSGVSDRVYLLSRGGHEVDVTAWAVAAESSTTKFVLALPSVAGVAPHATPGPGVYQLRVGSGAAGSSGATRTSSIPVSIAARVDPSGGPVLSGTTPFTVTGTGFVPGETEVLVGAVVLTRTAQHPGPGHVSIDATGTAFSFSPPVGPAGTVVPVRVRVNGIESDPAFWVKL